MAVKTRTPRTSSGIRKEQKAKRVAEQEAQKEANLKALKDLSGERFLQNDKGDRVKPSKALRKAQRAKRFANVKPS